MIGGGLIGNHCAQLFMLEGTEDMILADICQNRLEIVRRYGIRYVINSLTETPAQAITDINGGKVAF